MYTALCPVCTPYLNLDCILYCSLYCTSLHAKRLKWLTYSLGYTTLHASSKCSEHYTVHYSIHYFVYYTVRYIILYTNIKVFGQTSLFTEENFFSCFIYMVLITILYTVLNTQMHCKILSLPFCVRSQVN